MKKVKVFGGAALLAVAAFGLASCSSDSQFNISVVYSDDQGATYMQSRSYEVDGVTYTYGDLLPMWQVIEEKFGVDIVDSGFYTAGSTQSSVTSFMNNGYKGEDGSTVELLMSNLSQITTMANDGYVIALDDYAEYMPNYFAYLEEHPSIWNQLKQSDGKVYSTAYFDGSDDIEKYFMVASVYIKMLLDDDYEVSDMDTFTYDSVISDSMSGWGTYTPFNEDTTSYDVLVTDNDGESSLTVTVSYEHSIIYTLNRLSSSEATGQRIVQELRDYIDETYMTLEGSDGKPLFEERSDVFLSNSAVYNTDDFIALWRAIKANPKYLAGENAATEDTDSGYAIDVFVPRNNDTNRQRQVLSLMQIFGQKGANAESNYLYFDTDGVLQDARTQDSAYEAITKINQLYQEGLIIENYDGTAGTSVSWRDTKLSSGTGVVYYDYCQSTAATVPTDMIDDLGLVAIMPPAVDWGIYEKDGETLGSGTGTYIHFTEDARSLKSGAWCIPYNADEEYIITACQIMDYFYSDEGADLCDFGPNTTTYRAAVTQYDDDGNRIEYDDDGNLLDGLGLYKGEAYVIVSDFVFDSIDSDLTDYGLSGGWFEWYTRFVGNSLGFGNIRSSALELQFTEETYMQTSMTEISNAIAAGSMFICDTADHEGSSLFFQCVPTTWPLTSDQEDLIESVTQYAVVQAWTETSSSKTCGYTSLIKNGVTNLSTYQSEYTAVNTNFLEVYREVYESMNS